MMVLCCQKGLGLVCQLGRRGARSHFLVALAIVGLVPMMLSARVQEVPASAPTIRPVGTVKTIAGNVVSLATDAGSTLNIVIQDSTRIVRTAPGQKDLQGATPLGLADLQVGDRMLVRGKPGDDGGHCHEGGRHRHEAGA